MTTNDKAQALREEIYSLGFVDPELAEKIETLIVRERKAAVEDGLHLCHEKTADFIAQKLIPVASQVDAIVLSEMFPSPPSI